MFNEIGQFSEDLTPKNNNDESRQHAIVRQEASDGYALMYIRQLKFDDMIAMDDLGAF